MKKKKTILIDDHILFLEGLKLVLSSKEYLDIKLITQSALEALDFIKKENIEVVITDIAMPDMNGIELIKEIKKYDSSIKIIVISMFKSLQSYENIDSYLLKETNEELVLEALDRVILDNKTFFPYQEKKEAILDTIAYKKKTIFSQREKEIIRLISKELTTKEIAEKLFVTTHTINAHKKNVFYKLQVKNIAGMTKKAMYLGILE